MECPRCRGDHSDRASLRVKCGAALGLSCPQCHTELPAQANFCFHCGSPVMVPATESGQDALALLQRAVQRLAPQGYADRLLATGGQVGWERRTVTILFCDVQGSTALAEWLDPEEVMEVMDGAFDVLIPPICRYEGTVARLMGDAVLAFFGAPIAHEDEPERACLAALQIVEGAKQYATRLERERGIRDFDVRVGIHTGLVVVGEVGSDLRVEYTAMGDAVNLAQRLQCAAEPGDVLISADTQRLIAPLFETEALGPMPLRGRAQPVAVYRVLAAKPVPGKPRGIPGLDSALVGREGEMALLQQAIERLRGGQGGIVTIVGEAGIGKSRLVAEARKSVMRQLQGCHAGISEACPEPGRRSPPAAPSAPQRGSLSPSSRDYRDSLMGKTLRGRGSRSSGEEEILRFAESGEKILRFAESGEKILRFAQNDKWGGVQWVEGRCLSYGRSVAYQLWTDVLRYLLGVEGDAAPAPVRQALREWVQALCPERSDEVEPYLSKMMALPLQEEEEALLAQRSSEQMQAATLDALQTLIECTARRQPLVLVCEDIYWSDSTSMALLERLLALTEQLPLLLIAVLRPRKEHPSWRIRAIAAQRYADRHTDLWLQPLSAGHSRQVLSNLLPMSAVPETVQQRILERAEGNPLYVEEITRALIAPEDLARGVAEIAIPDTLNAVLTARIDQLPEATKRVLRMAAVIGRLFSYPVLGAICGLGGQLDPHLTALQEVGLIRERAGGPEREYTFQDELVRQAAYNGLLKLERRALHRQVAQALERLSPERTSEQLGLLAHHWEQAGEAEKAADFLPRAGERSHTALAKQQADGRLWSAVPLADEHDQQRRAQRVRVKPRWAQKLALGLP